MQDSMNQQKVSEKIRTILVLTLALLFPALIGNSYGQQPKAIQPGEVSGEYYDWTKTMQPERP